MIELVTLPPKVTSPGAGMALRLQVGHHGDGGRFGFLTLAAPRTSARLPAMKWTETILRWRQLEDAETQQRIRWERIPRQVASSMAFEQEPVQLSWLQKLHRQLGPPGTSKQPAGS